MIINLSPLSQNNECFLNNLTKMMDFFADTYDNYFIMDDFNIEDVILL